MVIRFIVVSLFFFGSSPELVENTGSGSFHHVDDMKLSFIGFLFFFLFSLFLQCFYGHFFNALLGIFTFSHELLLVWIFFYNAEDTRLHASNIEYSDLFFLCSECHDYLVTIATPDFLC